MNITVSDGNLSTISSLLATGQEVLSLSDTSSVVRNQGDDWQQVDKLSDSLYSFDETVMSTIGPNPDTKKPCTKKKDYEKLAPFKFFCKMCSFKSKRESHYQRHLELHNKVHIKWKGSLPQWSWGNVLASRFKVCGFKPG